MIYFYFSFYLLAFYIYLLLGAKMQQGAAVIMQFCTFFIFFWRKSGLEAYFPPHAHGTYRAKEKKYKG